MITTFCLWIIQKVNRGKNNCVSQRLFNVAELYNTKSGRMNYFVEGECPEFDDHDPEPILEWADAKIVYDDSEPFPSWYLTWKHGAIQLSVENEEKARKAGALFIYLWTRGIYAGVADRCATAYVNTHTITRI